MKLNNKAAKGLASVLAFTLLCGSLSGCGSQQAGETKDDAAEAGIAETSSKENVTEEVAEDPVPITIFAQSWDVYEDVEKDSVWKAVEEATNTELSLTGVPYNGYTDKLNVMINTGEIPDIFEHWQEANVDLFEGWAKEGLLVNLDDYVGEGSTEYPNIANIIYNDQYKNLTFDGQHIMIPWIGRAAGFGIYIRQDWLDNLGLEAPDTVEEFYEVMRAFTYDDPDGNGVDDTYGLSGCKDLYWFGPLYGGWIEKPDWNYSEDGSTMEYMYATENFKGFLEYMQKAYSEGLVVKDFYSKTDEERREDFNTGKAGIMFYNADFYTTVIDQMTSMNPNAKVNLIEPPEGPNGKNLQGWGGLWGGYSISASAPNIEACLKLLDYLVSEEGTKLTHYGIEGVHYTVDEDGSFIITEENLAARKSEPYGEKEGDRFCLQVVGDTEEPTGSYNWGQWFGPYRTFENGRIVLHEDFSADPNGDMVEKALGYCAQYYHVSDMVNVTVSNPEFSETSQKVVDETTNYAIRIITGEFDLEEGWNAMMERLDEIGYPQAQKTAYETMKASQ